MSKKTDRIKNLLLNKTCRNCDNTAGARKNIKWSGCEIKIFYNKALNQYDFKIPKAERCENWEEFKEM